MKICTKCNVNKSLDQFSKQAGRKFGVRSACKECCKSVGIKATRKYYSEHRNQYSKYRIAKYRTIKGRAIQLLGNARVRAKSKNVSFNLTVEYIEYVLRIGICEITGLPFEFKNEKGKRQLLSPSIDRKDSSKGYTYDNIQVVVWWYNSAKGQGTDKELLSYIKMTKENL